MDCFKIDYEYINDHNLIFPLVGLCGLFMTYLGNKFVRPTIFTLGTILSTGSSYKLIGLVMDHLKYDNCLLKYGISVVTGFSGGILAIKLYRLTYFTVGFICGGMIGYLLYDTVLFNYKLGIIYEYDTIFWLSIGIPGILSGILSLYKEKELSIMTTAFVGPLLTIYSVNQFTRYYNLFLFIGIYLLMSGSGLYIQYRKYRKDKNISYVGESEKLKILV